MYYFLMALVDIFFFITENWKELTATAIASGVGIILGKRLGSRIVVKQFMKALGLEKKSKLERKVEWLIEQEGRRGNTWPGNTATSSNMDRMNLKRLFSLSRMGKNHQFIRRTRKMREYLKKLGSRKFQSFVIGFITQIFILLKMDVAPYVDAIAAGGLILTTIVYIWVEGSTDKANIQKGGDEVDYSESDDTAA